MISREGISLGVLKKTVKFETKKNDKDYSIEDVRVADLVVRN